MNKLCCLIVVFSIYLNNANSQWINLNSGTTKTLNDIKVLNEDTIIIVGDSGLVLKTIDGGLNWNQYSANINERLLSVDFLNDSIGIAVIENGLLRSNNGGITWVPYQNLPVNSSFRDVELINDSIILVAGSFTYGNIIKSFDSGQSWIVDSLPTVFGFLKLTTAVGFANDSTWYAADQAADIFKTTNKGKSWQLKNLYNSTSAIERLQVVNDTMVFAVGNTPNCTDCFFSSIDGGNNWYSNYKMGFDLYFFHTGMGYFLNGKVISKSLDYGINYFDQRIMGLDTFLIAIKFANENIGYAVGNHGTILKTLNGGITNLNDLSNAAKSLNIYPNPITNELYIKTNSNQSKEIILYDITSRKLLQETFSNSTTLNTTQLANGIYIYEVRNKNGVLKQGKVIKE